MNNIADVLSGRIQTFPRTTLQAPEVQTYAPQQSLDTEEELDVHSVCTMLTSMKQQIEKVLQALDKRKTVHQTTPRSPSLPQAQEYSEVKNQLHPTFAAFPQQYTVLEGVFDGQNMMASDGQCYPVPANYASKSKMVEGDLLKLTITDAGKRFYKQIGPVKRATLIGELMQHPSGTWVALVGQTPYNLLTASVTFQKGRAGDKITILVPEDGGASWGAVDCISQTTAEEKNGY